MTRPSGLTAAHLKPPVRDAPGRCLGGVQIPLSRYRKAGFRPSCFIWGALSGAAFRARSKSAPRPKLSKEPTERVPWAFVCAGGGRSCLRRLWARAVRLGQLLILPRGLLLA